MLNNVATQDSRARKIFRRYFPVFLILWILLVLYPNPAKLFISIDRTFNFDVDASSVEFMLDDFSADPVAIEREVLERLHYSYDWEVHGMPWYFPTVEEVVQQDKGDCKARALMLASILEGKGIPYLVNVSPIHIWVDYEGKEENAVENAEVKFYQEDPATGRKWFQIPAIDLGEVMDSFWRGFWDVMPGARKILLLAGLVVLIAARVVLFRKKTVI